MAHDGDYYYTISGGKATITGYAGVGGAVVIPSTVGGYPVVSIGDYSFRMTSSLTSVVVPSGVTYIGTNAFESCHNLTSAILPNTVTTMMDEIFYADYNLTSINIPPNVTEIKDYTFSESALTSIVIPDNVTTIGQHVFELCWQLVSATLGKGLSTIGDYAFWQCSGLLSIDFRGKVAPASVGVSWIEYAPAELRGHAQASSDFPAPGEDFYGLTMGDHLPPLATPLTFGVILGGF